VPVCPVSLGRPADTGISRRALPGRRGATRTDPPLPPRSRRPRCGVASGVDACPVARWVSATAARVCPVSHGRPRRAPAAVRLLLAQRRVDPGPAHQNVWANSPVPQGLSTLVRLSGRHQTRSGTCRTDGEGPPQMSSNGIQRGSGEAREVDGEHAAGGSTHGAAAGDGLPVMPRGTPTDPRPARPSHADTDPRAEGRAGVR